MIDLNSSSMLSDRINTLVDDAIYLEHAWEPARRYLGASVVGHPCDRHVQYAALVAGKHIPEPPMPDPKLRRIFDRGNTYEAKARTWLSGAGFVFYPTPADICDFDGRFGGHVDGVIHQYKGVNTCPISLPCLWECKCLGAKGWKTIAKDGLKNYSPTYWGQVHTYLGYLELPNCLYTIVNADTMELHHIFIPFDSAEFQLLRAKVSRVFQAVDMGELLPRISQDPAFFQCTYCPYRESCWK